MVAMLDNDGSGKLGFDEFKTLWLDIRKWRVIIIGLTNVDVFKHIFQAVFRLYDPSGTGRIPASSLRDALHSCGYTLNNHILNILAHRFVAI
jgi:calpain, invertebrate